MHGIRVFPEIKSQGGLFRVVIAVTWPENEGHVALVAKENLRLTPPSSSSLDNRTFVYPAPNISNVCDKYRTTITIEMSEIINLTRLRLESSNGKKVFAKINAKQCQEWIRQRITA